MANLISTTSSELTATSITSPKMLSSNSYLGMNEWVGSVAINNGSSVDLICNVSGYARTIGLCNFFNLQRALGDMEYLSSMFRDMDYNIHQF